MNAMSSIFVFSLQTIMHVGRALHLLVGGWDVNHPSRMALTKSFSLNIQAFTLLSSHLSL